ncbi:MAG: hypothetical protein EXR76_02640 [Myxococcales bacterium]|nr:hypothetical protein [Myxococcales bacterium]
MMEWLRANGYPNIRRADTIRSEVVSAALKALGRGRALRASQAPLGQAPLRQPPVSQPPVSHPPAARGEGGANLKMSFAELIDEHFAETGPQASGGRGTTGPALGSALGPAIETPEQRIAAALEQREAARRESDEWRVRYSRVRSERDDAMALNRTLEPLAAQSQKLTAEVERLRPELHQKSQLLRETHDERATLEHTCAELQASLSEVRDALRSSEAREVEHRDLHEELGSTVQREMAWRTRALELERAAQAGSSLVLVLQRIGLIDPADQASLLRGVLSTRDGAVALMRALRPIDAEGLLRLFTERVTRVCVDPICNQVAEGNDCIVLRVDSERDCGVCLGSPDRRWFHRMVQECDRAGVRRLLIVGGTEACHEVLRVLGQTSRLDLRLVMANEECVPARVQGRVESCDVVVLFGPTLAPAEMTEMYAAAAQKERRVTASVPGGRSTVATLARSVCSRLTRSLLLATR